MFLGRIFETTSLDLVKNGTLVATAGLTSTIRSSVIRSDLVVGDRYRTCSSAINPKAY
jgi:hypothetical protein